MSVSSFSDDQLNETFNKMAAVYSKNAVLFNNIGATFYKRQMYDKAELAVRHDCNGVFPCSAINYGNQQGDYEGLVSYNGYSYPIWTDSRRQLDTITGCRNSLAMEEVFTAKVKP